VDGASYSFNPSETSDLKCARFSSRQPPCSNPLLFKPTEFFAALKNPKLVKQCALMSYMDNRKTCQRSVQ